MPKPNPYRQAGPSPDLTGPTHVLPWADQALCAEVGFDLFFPEGPAMAYTKTAEQAKSVCASCAVRPECLEHALTTDERYGIWGGMDPSERARLRRSRRTA